MTKSVEMLSVAEAHELKQHVGVASVKTWHASNWPNAAAFAEFLNVNPAQVAGEAFASSQSNGSVDGFWFL